MFLQFVVLFMCLYDVSHGKFGPQKYYGAPPAGERGPPPSVGGQSGPPPGFEGNGGGPPPGILGSGGPKFEDGECPRFDVVEDFAALRYLGVWYEHARFPAPFQDGDCVTATYGLLPNESISVLNQDDNGISAEGVAKFGPNKHIGRLFVSFPEEERQESNVPDFIRLLDDENVPNYNIIHTDYDNYAVIYSCSQIGPKYFELSWILGRRPKMHEGFLNDLMLWLQRIGLNISKYQKTNQKGCAGRNINYHH